MDFDDGAGSGMELERETKDLRSVQYRIQATKY